jgi:nitrogen fixation/metabolism regulation signal transduction histidine kinase
VGTRATLFTALVLAAAAAAWVAGEGRVAGVDARAGLSLGAALVAAVVLRRLVTRPGAIARAVSDGLLAYVEQDYSVRIAAGAADPWQLARRFNALGDELRGRQDDAYQKQLLLETVLRASPAAVVLENEAGRIVYANGTARELLGDGAPLEGRPGGDLLARLAPELREALGSPRDALFTVEIGGEPQVLDIAQRSFHINTQRHRLLMIRPLGRELERREAEAWKKAIRVMSHELNNSLAPISSLVHSARALLDSPRGAERLRTVLDTVEDRTRHLTAFLEGFARVARLPRPRPEAVEWAGFVASVQALHAFTVDGALPEAPGWFDRAQLQQVLINLVKNAHEAGSPADEVRVRVDAASGGVSLRVLDRGKGMTDEERQRATLPFYSTKKTGSGVGLALCREIVDAHGGRFTLAAREGGGTVVELWLPSSASG